jgi:hypothetical protein
MPSYAQTNRQLYAQLVREGLALDDILRVRRAHELAAELFSGFYRPSGSPFLSHLVGTASVLASLSRPVELVIAGLLHAAYIHGDFGRTRTGPSPSNRRYVRLAAGEDAESYIWRYTNLPWGDLIRGSTERLSSLDRFDKGALLIRLANELEHYLDDEILCGPNFERRRRYVAESGPKLSLSASALGVPQLAAELDRVMSRAATVDLVPGLQRETADVAYLISPPSYRKRPVLRARRLAWRAAAAARRAVGRFGRRSGTAA